MTAPLRAFPADPPPDAALLDEAAEVLRSGGLLAFPTETVYGLAARADDPDALARLAAVKERDPARALTWHAASAEAVLAARVPLAGLVGRLGARYWPGPLTLVLPAATPALAAVAVDGWSGVRVPAHDGTRELLARCEFPVVASSANTSGEDPLLTAEDVHAAFGTKLDLVLDGGPSRLGEPSAVLAVGPGRFEVLREGMLTAHDLRATAGLNLLFVCTGNTCRSPMAEALTRAALAERLGGDPTDFGFTIGSAGVSAGNGAPASGPSVEVMHARGLDLTQHHSRTALPELVTAADHVYCLTAPHRQLLLSAIPPGAGAHVELLDPDGADVPDPFGAPAAIYRACADAMTEMIARRLESWA